MAERLSEAKARRVYLILRDRILSNAFAPGARLPTEVDLARYHRVSRVTVRRALAELSREQLIERRRASGTRVIYQPSTRPMTADIANVLATLAEMGERTTSRLLSFGYVPAAGRIAEALGANAAEELQRSVRVRSSGGKPFSYLVAHVPGRIGRTYTRRELAGKPLLALLERSGVAIERAAQRVSAVLATPETAQALEVGVGSPLIELERVVYDRGGRGVEHLHALYRPDRYNLEMELERQQHAWTPAARKTSDKISNKISNKTSDKTRPTRNTSKGT